MINPQENNINTTNWIKKLSSFLLCLLAVLISTPYYGIWHDSVLYLGQALLRMNPEVFQKDLFFSYGSQAGFTLFPYALAWLIERFNAESIFILFTLLARLSFAIGSWYLLRALFPARFCIPAILALFFLPREYGSHHIFSYAETFLTGRSYAEPLVLLALASVLHGRTWLFALFWCMAAILHPLMALPVLVFYWFWLLQTDKRWIHALWVAVPSLFVFLFLQNHSNTNFQFDSEWLNQVVQRSPFLFFSQFQYGDWYYILTDFFIVFLLTRYTSDHIKKFTQSLLAAGISLFLIAALLVDVLHLSLPTGLQLWRVHWLIHWLAMASIPWLLWKHWQEHRSIPYLLLLGSIILSGIRPSLAGGEVPGLMVLYIAWPWIERHTTRFIQNGILFFIITSVLINSWMYYSLLFSFVSITRYTVYIAFKILFFLFLLLLAALSVSEKLKNNSSIKTASLLLMIFMLFPAVQLWDQRLEKDKFYESTEYPGKPAELVLEEDAQVLWRDNLLPTWQVLNRASYMSDQQMAGIVFNKETSRNAYLRKEALHVKKADGSDCRMIVSSGEGHSTCLPDSVALKQMCLKTHGELDYIVLSSKTDANPHAIWTYSEKPLESIYIYACDDFISPDGIPEEVS